MEDHQKTEDELIALLGNCVIALALGTDFQVLKFAREAADKHVSELNERFPGWEGKLS